MGEWNPIVAGECTDFDGPSMNGHDPPKKIEIFCDGSDGLAYTMYTDDDCDTEMSSGDYLAYAFGDSFQPTTTDKLALSTEWKTLGKQSGTVPPGQQGAGSQYSVTYQLKLEGGKGCEGVGPVGQLAIILGSVAAAGCCCFGIGWQIGKMRSSKIYTPGGSMRAPMLQ